MNRDFDGVDVDLLADYIGGALDGTPQHATVAGLIARDDAWQTAHEALAEGMAAVGAELNALGSAPEAMPPDVAERLDRAFPKPSAPHLVAVGGDERRARALPARPRRRLRWAVPVAVAAALLAFAGFGVDYLVGGPGSTTSAVNSAGGRAEDRGAENAPGPASAGAAPDAAKAAAPAALPPADRIGSTGTDYRHTTLATGGIVTAQGAPATTYGGSDVAAPLARLRPPEALLACLNAIAVENAAGPIEVQSVDYARYAGAPAVVVRFTAANGAWAWAAGPDCGTPGAGASRVDAAKVG